MSMATTDEHLDSLIAKLDADRRDTRADLERAQSELDAISGRDDVNDSGDAAVEANLRDGLLTRIERARTHLDELERAFGRIEAGTYGLCATDGEPIEPARLEAVPWAEYCVKHQPDDTARRNSPTL